MNCKIFFSSLIVLLAPLAGESQVICPPNPSNELVINGSFEKGINGLDGSFSSTLPNSGNYNGPVAVNQWGIVQNANNANNTYMLPTTAHSGTNLMLIDVGNSNNTNLWQQTIKAADLTPNTTYFFSCWLANVSNQSPLGLNNPSQVQLRINGVAVGADIDLPYPTSGQWIPYYVTWKSPAGTQSDIIIGLENVKKQSQGNDLALDDISFNSSCGNIPNVDALQPKKLMVSQASLCTGGGSALLDTKLSSTNKTFTWKNSGLTSFGSSTPTTTVNTAGTYYVCIDSAGLGCPITDTVVVTSNFSMALPDLDLCTPSQYTLDAGFNIPNSSIASISWSGPSGTSSNRNYTVTTAGAHNVTVTAAGGSGCGYSGSFNVTSSVPVAPTNLDYDICADTVVTLNIGNGKTYNWSANQSMSPLLSTSISYDWHVPNGTSGNQTLWVQDLPTSNPLGSGGPASIPNSTGWPDATPTSLTFTTTQTVVLNSFKVFFNEWAPLQGGGQCNNGSSKPVTYTITDGSSLTLTTTQNIPCSANGSPNTTVNTNWTLPAGTYTLTSSESTNFEYQGTINKNVGGIVTIANPNASHYMFADLNFNVMSTCDPVPIQITEKCCNPIADVPAIDTAASNLSDCDPTKVSIVSKALTNGLDYKWQVSHDGGFTWADSTATAVVTGGKVTLSNISGSGWFRLLVAATGNIGKVCMKISDTAQVVIPASIPPIITSPASSYCINGAVDTIEVNTPGGTFSTFSGLGMTNVASGYYDPKLANPGIDTIYYTTPGACGATALKAITINALPVVTFTLADNEVCRDLAAFALSGGLPTGGTFSGTGVTGGNTFTASVAGNGPHTITYSYTDPLTTCVNTATDQITVDALPVVTLALGTPSTCINTAAFALTGGSPVGGTYSGSGVNGANYDPSSTTTGPHVITYTYTDPSTTCTSSNTATLAVNAFPVMNLNDTSSCGTIVLDATANATIITPATYAWDGGAAGALSTLTVNGSGNHSVVVTDNNNCQASASFTVTIHPKPAVSLGGDTTVCFTGNQLWQDTIANTYSSILWSTGDADNTASLSHIDSVWVTVTNQFDCSASDTIYVDEHCDAIELCFPNVFTPNNDGVNDDFRPCGNEKEEIKGGLGGNYNFYSENILVMHFVVYDRWGLKMFENNLPTVPVWDGLFQNKLASTGTYYWIVNYTDSSNKSYEQTGYVTLLKD
ncbi:MAG: gliding motility-associated C-terminal domain-containing protein [Flavobacteriales bacterium]